MTILRSKLMPLISAYLCTLDRKFTGGPGMYTQAIWRGVGGISEGGNRVEGGVKFPHSPLATGPAVEASRMYCGLQKR